MTKEEALKIPELQITPNDLVEDCFYYKMALAGKISEAMRRKLFHGLKAKRTIHATKARSSLQT